MPVDPNHVETIFHAARGVVPADRAAFLDAKCGGDAELRARVERLLAAHDELASVAAPAAGATADFTSDPSTATFADPAATVDRSPIDGWWNAADDAPQPGAGALLAGRYKLVEEIGAGGMGTVWMAQQTEPVKRAVAVKLIKAGMDSRAVLARFEAERQALALMDHPNIAKVLDAGATPDGRPFFVMELVKGVPITQFCDDRKLTPRQRLELFVPVCQAIQHAHQKGIIHRDIKPSNVLVALYDDRPVPKVIDFGVAKAAGEPLTERTLATGFGGVVGTPEYMSPEQASFNNLDIDTRTDVYALGALLYELLAGSPPFSRKELERAGLLEILRVVREVEPPRPSAKLSTAEARPTLSANRGTEPKALARLLRGELDWIVMKGLEKDRNRRYETANGLAADVQRYLAGEPVQAVPPSATYRLRKFVRRNRGPVTAVGLVLFALVVGMLGTALALFEAKRQERIANDRRVDAENAQKAEAEQRKKADAARAEAVTKEAEANAVVKFFGDRVFTAVRPKGVAGGLGRDVALRDAILAALPALTEGFKNQPLIEARLRMTLGHALNASVDIQLALEQFERARAIYLKRLGADNPLTLNAGHHLAGVYRVAGRPEEALKLLEEIVAVSRRVFGPDGLEILQTQILVATTYHTLGRHANALKLNQEALAGCRRVFGPNHPETVHVMTVLGYSHNRVGQYDDAIRLLEHVLTTRGRPDVPEYLHLDAAASLAEAYSRLGRLPEAIKQLGEALAGRRRLLGPDAPRTLKTMQELANTYSRLGRHAEAIMLHEEALAIHRRVSEPNDPLTLAVVQDLARAYVAFKSHAEAAKLYEEVLAAQRKVPGPDHKDTLRSMHELAGVYVALGRSTEAIKLQEEILTIRRTLDPNNAETWQSMHNLGRTYLDLRRPTEAAKLYEEMLASRRKVLPPDDENILWSLHQLAGVYVTLGRRAEAIKLDAEALTFLRRVFGPEHERTLKSLHNSGAAYSKAGWHAEAVKLREELLAIRRRTLPPDHADLLSSAHNLGRSYAAMSRYADAAKLFEEALAGRRKTLDSNDKNTLHSLHELGLTYYSMRRYSEAAKLFEEALTRRRKVYGPDDTNTLHSWQDLGRCHAALGQHEKAVEVLEEVLAARRRLLLPDHLHTQWSRHELALSYTALRRHADALKLREEMLAIYERTRSPDDVSTLLSRRLVAESLIALGRGAEAIPHIDEYVKWASKRSAPLPMIVQVMALRLRHFQKANDPAGCRATAEMWEKLNRTDGPGLYDAACYRAVAAAVYAAKGQPDEAVADADRAMVWLTKAVAAGWRNRAHAEADSDLAHLRERTDFQKLLAALPYTAPPPRAVKR
jgi:eukaryotic-like serine/threonine-protein kinase